MKTATALLVLFALWLPTAAAQDGVPSFTYAPSQVRVGEPVTFQSTSTGNITNWTWDLGDGSTGYGESIQHIYGQGGDLVVTLTIRYDEQTSLSVGKSVRVADPAAEGLGAYLPNWLFWAMPLLVAGILLTLAWVVLQRGQPAIYNLVFFLLYAASGLKSLTEAFAVLTIGTPVNGTIIAVNASLSYVYAPLFLWFVLVFPRPIHPWFNEGRRGAISLALAVPFLLNQAFGFIPFSASLNYFNGFVSILALACLGLLVYHAWETDSYEERARIRYLAVTFALLVVGAVVISLLNLFLTYQAALGNMGAVASLQRATAVFGLVILPFFEIAGAMLLMYAILRFQLMGIQTLVVKITRGATVALMVPATFIIVGNVIEEIFQSVVLEGVRFDFIIAGFVSAFAMAPVQKFTTFMLNKFLPALSAEDEALRRIEIYATQLRYSLLDGELNDKELRTLGRLAQEIKLQPQELDAVRASFPTRDLSRLALPSAPTSAAAA